MEPGSQAGEEQLKDRSAVRHLLILGHPDPGSFNHAVAARYAEVARANYQEVELRDLYAIGFDPLLKKLERSRSRAGDSGADVRHELGMIEQSNVVTFIYPLWFGTPPAIVKGYIDRVFGAAFRIADLRGERESRPFAGKTLSLFTSSAGSGPWLDEMGLMSSLQQSFGRYLETLFGFSAVHFFHADLVIDDMGAARAEQLLFDAGQKARAICAEAASARHLAGV